MPKKNGIEGINLTEEETKAKRLEAVAAKKKRALETLAEAEQMERDLGVEPDNSLENQPQNGVVDSEEQARLSQILEEIDRNNGYWEVYRMSNGTRVKVGRYDIASWPDHLEAVASEVGGGTLTVQFRNIGGTYMGQLTRHFDPSTYKPRPAQNQPPQEPHPGVDFTARFMEMMDRREAQYKSEMADLRRENMELQKTMFQALTQNDPFKSVNGIKTLIEMMRPEKTKPLEAVREVVDMFRLMRGENIEPPSLIESLLTKAVDVLGPVLKASVGKAPAEAAPPAKGPESSPLAAPAPTPALALSPGEGLAQPAKETPKADLMQKFAEQLLQFITGGASPETAASAIADLLDEANAKEFKPYTDDPAIADKLMASDPRLSQSRVWLVEFCKIMKEYVDETLTPEAPEPSANA